MQKVDVIIPTYKPDGSFFELVEKLHRQTVEIHQIIVMNTEEKYFQKLIYGRKLSDYFIEKVKVYHLSKREFDHGATRNRGVQRSKADIFVMMTQDACPADEHLIENLVCALEEEQTAAAYARQLPRKDCRIIEQYTRRFNYPEQSHVRTKADLEQKGIKTYFCSNVCAAYKRDIYDKLGGFIKHTIFNEDMIYAAKAIQAGYQIAYEAGAQVYHSHNYTNLQQFKRNFDLGVSQADHPEVFAGVPSETEGKKMVKAVTAHLKKSGKWGQLFYFYSQCGCKYAGFLLGRNYRKLPKKMILKCTMSPAYWTK